MAIYLGFSVEGKESGIRVWGLVYVYPVMVNMMPVLVTLVRTIADRVILGEGDDRASFASVSLACMTEII